MQSFPLVIGVGGFSSNVGKTTLMVELLKGLKGWEAIKTSRGHYRSCGKDPNACCVSGLLRDVATVRSGRESTYEAGKDTGRYWDAGATNVHWVIATDEQVQQGIMEALSRVKSVGVLVEGNSFAHYMKPDLMIMVTTGKKEAAIKKTARATLPLCDIVYAASGVSRNHIEAFGGSSSDSEIFTKSDLPNLLDRIRLLELSKSKKIRQLSTLVCI